MSNLVKTRRIHLESMEPLPLLESEFDRDLFIFNLGREPQVEMKTLLSSDNQVIAVLGAYHLWEGVADVFLVPSDIMPDHVFCYINAARKELNDLAFRNSLHRVQTMSLADAQIDKFMELLGFTWEGNHLKYSREGKNYRSWARFPNAV